MNEHQTIEQQYNAARPQQVTTCPLCGKERLGTLEQEAIKLFAACLWCLHRLGR